MRKERKVEFTSLEWRKLKPITVVDITKDDMDEECDDFRHFVSEVCLKGYKNTDDLPMKFVASEAGNAGLRWLRDYGYIEEDKTALFKSTISALKDFPEKHKELYSECPWPEATVALIIVDFLIKAGLITKGGLARAIGKTESQEDDI